MKATHSQQLERWLGTEKVAQVSTAMKGWYGPPIAVHGVPGEVYATKDGDFIGKIRAGYELSSLDRAEIIIKRILRHRPRQGQLNAGFTSLSDLIAEASGGKRQELAFQKTGVAGAIAFSTTLWRLGAHPAAGAVSGGGPGGTVPTSATTGALLFTNAGSGDTLHFISANLTASSGGQCLLLYDRIFSVLKASVTATTTEAVTGVPTRYQNTVAGTADSAEGNFLVIEVGTVLGAGAHNWTVCTYTDQSGNAAATLPSVTGIATAAAARLDMPNWFCPLAAGDSGVKALTQMQQSATATSGAIEFVIGHPIAFMPCLIANFVMTVDGVNTAFNLARIFDGAALGLLEIQKSAATATTYTGTITAVSG